MKLTCLISLSFKNSYQRILHYFWETSYQSILTSLYVRLLLTGGNKEKEGIITKNSKSDSVQRKTSVSMKRIKKVLNNGKDIPQYVRILMKGMEFSFKVIHHHMSNKTYSFQLENVIKITVKRGLLIVGVKVSLTNGSKMCRLTAGLLIKTSILKFMEKNQHMK